MNFLQLLNFGQNHAAEFVETVNVEVVLCTG